MPKSSSLAPKQNNTDLAGSRVAQWHILVFGPEVVRPRPFFCPRPLPRLRLLQFPKRD